MLGIGKVHIGLLNSKFLLVVFIIFAQSKVLYAADFSLFIQDSLGVYINEVMASNSKTILDENNNSSDWIEIYNASNEDFDLAGYYLTDNIKKKTKFRFPNDSGLNVVPANGFKIIWASGENLPNHVTWALSIKGEDVYLIDTDGETIIDGFSFPVQYKDVSYGRHPDNLVSLVYFSPSSPEIENVSTDAYKGILSPPVFSQEGGVYNSNFSLNIHTDQEVEIYYTLDSSDPDSTNLDGDIFYYKNQYNGGPLLSQTYQTYLFEDSIFISDRSQIENSVSMKASQGMDIPTYLPQKKITKGTVVRARTMKEGYLSSEIVTNTYFVFPKKYNIPIHSIVLSEKYLFDYNIGIYTPGIHYDTLSIQHPICKRGNYWLFKGTGYPGSFEFFELGDRKVSENVEIRVHGGCSIQNRRKAIRFKFDKGFGYPFFDGLENNKFRWLLARGGGNEDGNSMIRDVVFHDMSRYLDLEYMEMLPSISFINGEYWGMSFLRERVDDIYLEMRTGVSKNNMDIIEMHGAENEIKAGDTENYNDLISFIENNPLSDSVNYELFKELVDVDNLIDYFSSEVFIGNTDWPDFNLRLWRAREDLQPGVKFFNGKWRYILYDVDISFGLGNVKKDINSLIKALREDLSQTFLFRKAFESPEFSNKFYNRFADILNTHYHPYRSRAILDKWKIIVAPEIDEHIERWSDPYSKSHWLNHIAETMDDFLKDRPEIIRKYVSEYFSLSGVFDLTIKNKDTTMGAVQVNTIMIDNSTPGIPEDYTNWTGSYFKEIPVVLTAKAKPGYKFKYWKKGDGTKILDRTITINAEENVSYKVYFEEFYVPGEVIPEAYTGLYVGCKYEMLNWQEYYPQDSVPANSAFVYFKDVTSRLNSEIEGLITAPFNGFEEAKVYAKGEYGFSFVNSNGKIDTSKGQVSGLIVAINTLEQDSVIVNWTGRTYKLNDKPYGIRFQYRLIDPESSESDTTNFVDFDPIINYVGRHSYSDSTVFRFSLPDTLMNQPYVQLLWRYYSLYEEFDEIGVGDELGVDDIEFFVTKEIKDDLLDSITKFDRGYTINNSAKIISPETKLSYSTGGSITLEPGFETFTGVVFEASALKCKYQ